MVESVRGVAGKYLSQGGMSGDDACDRRCAKIAFSFLPAILTIIQAMGFASLVPSFSSETHIEYGLYLQNNFGTAAVFLSLATNVIATSLIAVKTW